jgi:hypothetical protein
MQERMSMSMSRASSTFCKIYPTFRSFGFRDLDAKSKFRKTPKASESLHFVVSLPTVQGKIQYRWKVPRYRLSLILIYVMIVIRFFPSLWIRMYFISVCLNIAVSSRGHSQLGYYRGQVQLSRLSF